MIVWLLVLFTIGQPPSIVQAYETGADCHAKALFANSSRLSTDHVPDPSKRYACFVLEPAT